MMELPEYVKRMPQLCEIEAANQAYQRMHEVASIEMFYITAWRLYRAFGAPFGSGTRALAIWEEYRLRTTQN